MTCGMKQRLHRQKIHGLSFGFLISSFLLTFLVLRVLQSRPHWWAEVSEPFGCHIIMPNKTKKHTHTNKSSTTLLKRNQKNGILSARLIESPKTHAKASNPNPVLQSSSSSSSFFTGSSGAGRRSSLTTWLVFFRFWCPFQAFASFQRQAGGGGGEGGGDRDKRQKRARDRGRRGNSLIEGKQQKRDKTQFHRDLENVVRAITEEEQEEDAEAHHAYLL